jgi:hypothetical protein
MYEVIVTAVRDRADLLGRTLRSMIPQLDRRPQRIIVHEDTRSGVECPATPTTRALLNQIAIDFDISITLLECNPGRGLGHAVKRLLDESRSELVLYTQEDFDFVRALPMDRCLRLMTAHELHHVRFNKRKTMRVKGADRPPDEQFHKIEMTIGGETLCVSDHWYFQASMWRRSIALEGFTVLADAAGPRMINRCEMAFNRWLNSGLGEGIGSTDSTGAAARGERVRTFIWGSIGEPAFIRHTGHDRRSQGWPDPEKRSPNS